LFDRKTFKKNKEYQIAVVEAIRILNAEKQIFTDKIFRPFLPPDRVLESNNTKK
jgi:hypothetical protein